MRKLGMIVGAAIAMAASPSQAATFIPGSPEFRVIGNISNGPVAASIGNTIDFVGDFTDTFLFRIDQFGTGSGSITSGTTALLSSTDLDIISVMVNGQPALKSFSSDGLTERFDISNVQILSGELNSIVVTGFSRGFGSYGGNATFLPGAVPEPATWAMLMLGFGLVGTSMRSRRKAAVRQAIN